MSTHTLRISARWTEGDPDERELVIWVCLVDGADAELACTGAQMQTVTRTFAMEGLGPPDEPSKTGEEELLETVERWLARSGFRLLRSQLADRGLQPVTDLEHLPRDIRIAPDVSAHLRGSP